MTRLGKEPVKIEILNHISGITFSEARPNEEIFDVDGIAIPVISLEDLRTNKASSGRPKDLLDLQNLPET